MCSCFSSIWAGRGAVHSGFVHLATAEPAGVAVLHVDRRHDLIAENHRSVLVPLAEHSRQQFIRPACGAASDPLAPWSPRQPDKGATLLLATRPRLDPSAEVGTAAL